MFATDLLPFEHSARQPLTSQPSCSLRPSDVWPEPMLGLQRLAGTGSADSVNARNCVPGTGLKLTGGAGAKPSER